MLKKPSLLALTFALAGTCLSATSFAASGVPAGTVINNQATTSYVDDNNAQQNVPSNTVTAQVQQVAGVTITPHGDANTPGQIVPAKQGTDGVLTYTVTNVGNGPDSFNVTVIGVSQNVVPTNAVIYEDTNGNGQLDPATDKIITNGTTVTLPEDGSEKIFVTYPIPNGTAGGTNFDLTPKGVSNFDNTAVDQGSVGRLTVKNDLSLTLSSPSQTGTITSPGSLTYTQVLSNSGNAPVSASNVAGDVSSPDTAKGWTYTLVYNGTDYANFAALLNASGPVAQNGTLTFGVRVTDPAGTPKGTASVGTFRAYITTPSDANTNNLTPQSNPATLTDTTTVRQGVAAASKVQSLGALNRVNNAVTFGPDVTTAITPRPCDVIRYTVNAQNQGDSALAFSTLTDTLSADLLPVRVEVSPNVIFKVGGTWQKTAPAYANGDTVTVGYDSNGDGTVNAQDTLAPGTGYNLVIYGQVKRTVDSCPAPVVNTAPTPTPTLI